MDGNTCNIPLQLMFAAVVATFGYVREIMDYGEGARKKQREWRSICPAGGQTQYRGGRVTVEAVFPITCNLYNTIPSKANMDLEFVDANLKVLKSERHWPF